MMDTSPFFEFDAGSEVEKFILSHESLRPGDKLEGKILEIKKNGKVLISFGKFRAIADIKFPIKVGQTINVVVESKDQQLKFRAVNPRPQPQPVRGEEQVFFFSMPLKESKKNAELKVYLPKKEMGKKGFRVSLLLDMDRLEETRIDFFLVEKNLNITFFVKTHDIKEEIETGLREIRDTLEGLFQHLVLNVIVSGKKIGEFITEDVEIPAAGTRMVDVKV